MLTSSRLLQSAVNDPLERVNLGANPVAKFNKIPEAKAPPAVRSGRRLVLRMQEYDAFLLSLKDGEVGEVTPEAGETPHGIAIRFGRAGKRTGRELMTWLADGKVYVQVR